MSINKSPARSLERSIDSVESEVAAVLAGYAERGIFRGFSSAGARDSSTHFKISWHYGRMYGFVLNSKAGSVAVRDFLVGVPGRSSMARNLRKFVRTFLSEDKPEHRRVLAQKADVDLRVRQGCVTISAIVKDGDFGYATRKLIHIVHEIFLVFLVEGAYYEYRINQLGVDPDSIGV